MRPTIYMVVAHCQDGKVLVVNPLLDVLPQDADVNQAGLLKLESLRVNLVTSARGSAYCIADELSQSSCPAKLLLS